MVVDGVAGFVFRTFLHTNFSRVCVKPAKNSFGGWTVYVDTLTLPSPRRATGTNPATARFIVVFILIVNHLGPE